MAQFFGAKSVQEFAAELVRSNSFQRLTKLCEFYTHRSPELSDLVKRTFPKPQIQPKPPSSPPPSTSRANRQRTTSKRNFSNTAQRHLHEERDDDDDDDDDGGTVKKKKTSNKRSAVDSHRHSGGQTRLKNQKLPSSPESGRSSPEPPRPSKAVQPQPQHQPQKLRSECNSSEVSSPPLRPTPEDQASSKAGLSNRTFISDLIGDTSILDDLFKPKRSSDGPKPATSTERTKNRGKDFWDILNEGNEESINKLTDLSQVEKFCKTVSVSGRSKSKEQPESSQLWKKNEKFLWK